MTWKQADMTWNPDFSANLFGAKKEHAFTVGWYELKSLTVIRHLAWWKRILYNGKVAWYEKNLLQIMIFGSPNQVPKH